MPVASSLSLLRRPAGRIRPQLDGLKNVLEELANPQQAFSSVLIVGTNGKGSTAVMLERILRSHGVVTGLYTSPHLVEVEERLRINGEPVAAEELDAHVARLDEYPDLTYFETLTAAAFSIFAERGVDVAVLEAGMGGSWDATRLAGSAIAGLTNVGSDHTKWLGKDRRQIARDKGAALAAARWPVLGAGVEEGLLEDLGAPAAVSAGSLVQISDSGAGLLSISWDGVNVTVNLPLSGIYQSDNAQLAVALAVQAVSAGWLDGLDPDSVRSALEATRWPGRLSVHRIADREVLVDCAHNLEAVQALVNYLEARDRRFNLLFSCLDDKPLEEMASLFRDLVGAVAVVELDDERAMPIDRLLGAFPGAKAAATPADGLEILPDPVLAAGSIRLVGALLAAENVEIGW